MKRTIAVLSTILFVLTLFGARLMNQPVTITQPDGTELQILASGDEFHNWLHDSNNYTIIQNGDTGWYTYAVKENNKVIAGQYIVGQSNPSSLGLTVGVNLNSEQKQEKRRLFYGDNTPDRSGRAPHFGTINNLVVFIKFSDSPSFSHELTYYNNMFNNSTENYNSMRNYFQAVSYNQLDIVSHFYPLPNNNTIVCYVDSFPRAYYMPLTGSNPIGYDENDYQARAQREFSLLGAASNYVSTQIPATLDLDSDDDGDIDNVCFIIQGTTTAWATLLWPHRWSIHDSDYYINGARVFDFNFQLESFMNSSGNSVLCHEMTHTLGAPDLYRYNDNTIDPIGEWDLMCGNANPPQSTSAWMKHKYMEWVSNVPTLTQSGTYTINSVWSPTNNIYRIPSWKNNEYYVVEYRKPFGIYDVTLPGYGLLIYRLNMTVDGNADGPPDELYIYRPYGVNTTSDGFLSMANFSLQTGRTFMNETTSPSGFMSNDTAGGLDIFNISASGEETMTFSVNISNVQVTYPKGGETFFSGSSKIVSWKSKVYTGNVRIEFSANNGLDWEIVVASTPNDGTYTWPSIPFIDSNECLLKVTVITTGSNDSCNLPFNVTSTISAPEAIFPSNQLVNAPTNPTFSWNAVPGAESYYLQVADDSSFVNTVFEMVYLQATTYRYNELAPFTTYYWRVAAYASVGLSDFSPTRMFTTGQISIIPAVPSTVSPQNFSTNQPRNTTLSWDNAAYAQYYQYQVATDAYFTNIAYSQDSLYVLQITLPVLAANTRHYWRVRSANPAGYSNYSTVKNFTTGDFTPSFDDEIQVITRLEQNYPNPFKSKTSIDYTLKDTKSPVKLTIYNLKGQVIKVLYDGITKTNINRLTWDGTDINGKAVSSGIYYYKLETRQYIETRKMVLIN